jgi:hypothetical protein
MTRSRRWIWALSVVVVVAVGLIVVGAIVANGSAGEVEGAYFSRSAGNQGSAAYVVVDDEASGTPWLVAGFALLALSLAAGLVRARAGRR